MSTPCKIKVSNLYPASQVMAEIAWIDKEIVKVSMEMKKRPSKIRHLNDLKRQRRDREKILDPSLEA